MRRGGRFGDVFVRGGGGGGGGHRQLKEQIIIIISRRKLSVVVAVIVLLMICAISLFFFTFNGTTSKYYPSSSVVRAEIGMDELSATIASGGWRSSSVPRADWPPPPNKSNGYLCFLCYGGFIEQRTKICNAVLVARIMNATLVLPKLDSRPDRSFHGIFDVEHFIKSLRYDVQVVESLPESHTHGKMKAYQMDPPPNVPLNWYATVALEKMKEHGAIYLTSFSHSLEEDYDNHEFQRLRCRVNYHALRFKPQLMKLSKMLVSKFRSDGHFLAISLEPMNTEFSKCHDDIFTPEELQYLSSYVESNVYLEPSEIRALGLCSLTPEEVGLILRAMGFDNSTTIYLANGEFYGGERYMKPFLELFPHLENQNTVIPANEKNTRGLLNSAVDYMACLQADIFMATYAGTSEFATNVMDHRLYNGFRTTKQPDRKALAPIFIDREKKKGNATAASAAGFEEAVRRVMFNTNKFGDPHKREESFYINPWPDCFCQISAPKNSADHCPPPENLMELVNSFFGFLV